ncbi:hypothetical protein [Paracoccus haematequi]|uniref:hypothetical protein n=1 Tax=Paracoccus haematequi TaxID=2491866 RepID=UPI0019D25EEC|nr:hypothetical protein [Paracoccus haematequi]
MAHALSAQGFFDELLYISTDYPQMTHMKWPVAAKRAFALRQGVVHYDFVMMVMASLGTYDFRIRTAP